jgi:hypothetical protein
MRHDGVALTRRVQRLFMRRFMPRSMRFTLACRRANGS